MLFTLGDERKKKLAANGKKNYDTDNDGVDTSGDEAARRKRRMSYQPPGKNSVNPKSKFDPSNTKNDDYKTSKYGIDDKPPPSTASTHLDKNANNQKPVDKNSKAYIDQQINNGKTAVNNATNKAVNGTSTATNQYGKTIDDATKKAKTKMTPINW
jgi:hypothetical protein